jgi:hypothetical protein
LLILSGIALERVSRPRLRYLAKRRRERKAKAAVIQQATLVEVG